MLRNFLSFGSLAVGDFHQIMVFGYCFYSHADLQNHRHGRIVDDPALREAKN